MYGHRSYIDPVSIRSLRAYGGVRQDYKPGNNEFITPIPRTRPKINLPG